MGRRDFIKVGGREDALHFTTVTPLAAVRLLLSEAWTWRERRQRTDMTR
jgi:hypothetical protein